ncbi:MAG: hypothetical protein EU548_09565 [Promethearchaeota archaeon]|nr:MAG: hypothetical protein EU548_09565 [Candidatus Lokiarchaeota archaeon]
MIVTILAAGKGKRMRPLTDTRLKGSMPIHNIPLLVHLANQLEKTGYMDKLVLVISPWQKKAMKQLFSKTIYSHKVHITIQDPPKGTGDAVAKAEPFIENTTQCLVLNGDINTDLCSMVPKILKHHNKLNAKCTMLVFPGQGTRYGLLNVTSDGEVLDIKEKVQAQEIGTDIGYINAGVYLFEPEIFDCIKKTPLSKRGEYEITDSISLLAKKGIIGAVITDKWMSLENPLDLFKAQSYFDIDPTLLNMQFHSGGEIGFKAANDIYFDSETEATFSSIFVEGPVLIGQGTLIESQTKIGPNVYLGRNCEIGFKTEIVNSLVMNDSRIGDNCLIRNLISAEDILIGRKVKLLPAIEKANNLANYIVLGGKTIIGNETEILNGLKIKAHSVINKESEIKSDYK